MEYSKLIVDGYNIIHLTLDRSRGQAFNAEKGSLEKKRSSLIEKMLNFSAYTGTKVIVVFDGQVDPNSLSKKERFEGIEIVYSKKGQSADSIIERLLYQEENPGSVVVATSDYALRDMVFGSGANCISALDLGEEVMEAEEEMRRTKISP